ncbi:hypothetical protein AYI68_g8341 [Smittium mucronatum]|uniref:Uncharacterized protein n=1 Tax=Smittium mucronatum TaxID=133383 RepID=A0A1R0GL67_9FUNG|nr:hypothetical protein AYI68_g8341 [Smittium mucronatum]
MFVPQEIELFASNLNKKQKIYHSWFPDTEASQDKSANDNTDHTTMKANSLVSQSSGPVNIAAPPAASNNVDS